MSKVRKVERLPIYYVEWEDSESWSGWSKKDRFPESNLCTTVGFLVAEEERYFLFAGSNDGIINGYVSEVMRIPKVAIRKKRRILYPDG